MKVDRSLFLVLAGALATGTAACVVKEYQPPPPPPPAPPPPQANNSPPPAPGQPAPHLGALHLANNGGQPAPAPAPAPGPFHFGPLKPTPGPAPAPSPSPSSCLDSGGVSVPAMCNPQLCPSNPFDKTRCGTYSQYFDPKVASAAIVCLNNLSGGTCDSQHAYDCGKSALAQACPDQTVSQLCQIATGPCKVAQTDCVNMISGLNSAGQDAVAQCVAGGCNGGNLYSCIEGLNGGTSVSRH